MRECAPKLNQSLGPCTKKKTCSEIGGWPKLNWPQFGTDHVSSLLKKAEKQGEPSRTWWLLCSSFRYSVVLSGFLGRRLSTWCCRSRPRCSLHAAISMILIVFAAALVHLINKKPNLCPNFLPKTTIPSIWPTSWLTVNQINQHHVETVLLPPFLDRPCCATDKCLCSCRPVFTSTCCSFDGREGYFVRCRFWCSPEGIWKQIGGRRLLYHMVRTMQSDRPQIWRTFR